MHPADEVAAEVAPTAAEVVAEAASRVAKIVAEVASTADEVVAEAASTADEGGLLSDGDRHVAAEMAGKLRAGHCPHQQHEDHSYPAFLSAAALQRLS